MFHQYGKNGVMQELEPRPATQPLHRLAKTIRSKNAGAHHYTLDIIVDDR